jgi:putative membrane protein
VKYPPPLGIMEVRVQNCKDKVRFQSKGNPGELSHQIFRSGRCVGYHSCDQEKRGLAIPKPGEMTTRSGIFPFLARPGRSRSSSIVAFLVAGAACLLIILSGLPARGPLAQHMALHILLMNAAAPVAALLLIRIAHVRFCRLHPAAFLQIAMLWGWHAPPVLEWALAGTVPHLTMQLSLFAIALLFWVAILAHQMTQQWRAILALLLTSKLYCLLGALLIFAPVTLFPGIHGTHASGLAAGSALTDQQAAGLLMLIVCPVTYISAGVVMAAQWLQDLSALPANHWISSAANSSSQGR